MKSVYLVGASASIVRVYSGVQCGRCSTTVYPGGSLHPAVIEPASTRLLVCDHCAKYLRGAGFVLSPRPAGEVDASSGQPQCSRPSNTGAQNPKREGDNRFGWSVDYLAITFKALTLSGVLSYFTPEGADVADWVMLPCGRMGYKTGYQYGDVRVYADGGADMGVHLEAKGQGVRQLEASGVVRDWQQFAADMLELEALPARIDIAFDDRAGVIKPEEVDRAVSERRVVSRFKKSLKQQEETLSSVPKQGEGWTRYFGSSTSRVRVRMYDKQAERAAKGEHVAGHWVRCELQTRNERAEWILGALARGAVDEIAGVVYHYLDFKERGTADRRCRWQSCEWWLEFLSEVEKVKCTLAQSVPTMERAAAWIEKQVAGSLAMLLQAPQYGADWVERVFERGAGRMRPWQVAELMKAAAISATSG